MDSNFFRPIRERQGLQPLSPLRLDRIQKAVTLAETAFVSGIPATRLSLLERGIVSPRPGEVEAVHAAINLLAAQRAAR